jgi:drug/metabolite transporter (DMT)-like permease
MPDETPPRGIRALGWNAPYLLLTLAVLFWSGNFIVGRAIAGDVPPVTLAFWRWTIGLVFILALGYRQLRADLPVLWRNWPMVVLLAGIGIAVFNTLVYFGLQSTTAVNGLLLQSAMPLLILMCSFVLFRERPSLNQTVGVLVSIVGVMVIACRGDLAVLVSLSVNMGDVWILVAVLSYAVYSALLRKRPTVAALSFLAATFFLGALMLVPLYAMEMRAGRYIEPVASSYLAILYVAAFPGFLSYLFFNRGVELVGANRAGHFLHLMPVFGSALAILFLGEAIRGFHLAGIALIGGGILFAMLPRRNQRSAGSRAAK